MADNGGGGVYPPPMSLAHGKGSANRLRGHLQGGLVQANRWGVGANRYRGGGATNEPPSLDQNERSENDPK